MKYKLFFKVVLGILIMSSLSLNACNDAKSEQIVNTQKTGVQNENIVDIKSINNSESDVKSELEKAKKEGKAVFLVVTGTGVTDLDKAIKIANDAKGIYKNSVVLQMNRDDKENVDLVAQWGLSGAPLPLILVISTKGFLVGGRILAEATPENIAELVPSPKLELIYGAIANKKHTIVVFTKKSFSDRTQVINIAKEAVTKLNGEAIFVEVDLDDNKETSFITQMRIDKNTTKASVTYVINNQGQVAGISTTIPNADKLVSAAKTPVKSGCGPGCGPAGCGN